MNNSNYNPHAKEDLRNMIIAIVLSLAILVGWRFYAGEVNPSVAPATTSEKQELLPEISDTEMVGSAQNFTRADKLASNSRIKIISDNLHGSIDLQGLRLDDLTLAKYRENLDKNSDEIILLTPRVKGDGYFSVVGWVGNAKLPDENTLWQTDAKSITPDSPALFYFENGEGLRFEVEISLDANYMFSFKQRVINNSEAAVNLASYSMINRTLNQDPEQLAVQHLGILASNQNALEEPTYAEVRDMNHKYDSALHWLGITDKYWLTALLPDAADKAKITGTVRYYASDNDSRYQLEMLGEPHLIAVGATKESKVYFFAGAKESNLLADYAEKYQAQMFDRAVDFGVLYFLTKPLLILLQWLYAHVGNFGLAIMGVTVILKLIMYPLANKSYASMAQMKLLMPKMEEIRARFPDDKLRMNQEIMKLYKTEKVNPASGCLPLLVQIPVFFALYKVLYIAIEMRQAPFYGWIKDLSVADPTNIFNLFGLISWNPPSMLHIGVLPLLMSLSMIIQQRMNPKPADPVQAQIIGYMPYIFVFIFASFPAGLVLYWVWSNVLSIAQQYIISRRYAKIYDKKTGKRLHK
jgi:YidC/Oxa1 family membrane protein insertase